MRVVLASKSPRRKQILKDLGVDFEVVTVDTEEYSNAKNPKIFVEDISREKGRAVLERIDDKEALIISADTVVVLDDKILGKPKDEADAIKMLSDLSGKTHKVITAISLHFNGKVLTDHSVTEVTFDSIDEDSIKRYVDSKEPMDKAGAYAVQGKAAVWIKAINGCYFNVVGFPTHLIYDMLNRIDINPFDVLNF